MKIVTAICAETAVIDSSTGSVSLINIIENMMVPGFPFFIPKITLYLLFEKEQGDQDQVEIKIETSIGEFWKHPQPGTVIKFEGGKKARLITTFYGVPIPASSFMKFSISGTNLAYIHEFGIEQMDDGLFSQVDQHRPSAADIKVGSEEAVS